MQAPNMEGTYTMLTASDLKGMLADPQSQSLLVEFTTKNHTSENIHFLSAVREFRLRVNKMAKEIYDKFLDPASDDCVNVDETVRSQITKQMATQAVTPVTVFDPAETAIISLVVCEPLQDFASWAHDRGGVGKVVSTKKRDVYSVFKTDVDLSERTPSRTKMTGAGTPRTIGSLAVAATALSKPEIVESPPESPPRGHHHPHWGVKATKKTTSTGGDKKNVQAIKPPVGRKSDERRKSVDQGEGIHLRNPLPHVEPRSTFVERGFLFSDEFKAQSQAPREKNTPREKGSKEDQARKKSSIPTLNCPPTTQAQFNVLPAVLTPSDEKRDVFETYLKYVDQKMHHSIDNS